MSHFRVTVLTAIVTGAIAMLAIGCSNTQRGSIIGSLVGGAVGGQIGKGTGRVAGRIAGSVGGSIAGARIGKKFDHKDYRHMHSTFEYERTGSERHWKNSRTHRNYFLHSTRTYYSSSGRPCREFELDVMERGRVEKIRGIACRQRNGTWRIIK